MRLAPRIRLWFIMLRLAARGPWSSTQRVMAVVAIVAGVLTFFWAAARNILDPSVSAMISVALFLILMAIRVVRPQYRDSVIPPTGRAGTTFRLVFTNLPPDALMVTSFVHPDGYVKVETYRNKTQSGGMWDLRVGTGDYSPLGEYVYRVSARGVVRELKFQIVDRRKDANDPRRQMPFVPDGSNPPSGGPDTMFLVMFTGLPLEGSVGVDALMPDGSVVQCGDARATRDGRLRVVYYSRVAGEHVIRTTHEAGVKEVGLTISSDR